MISISKFLSQPSLLGGDFGAPSWKTWKVLLKAAFAERMTAAERAEFRELAQRDPPPHRVRELWLALGRRAGKDSAASAIATYLAVYGDFRKHLRRGERAAVLCLAVDRTQAGIVFGYIKSYFEEIALLRPMMLSADREVISLNNSVDIVVTTNSFRALRGRTVACAILDEVAFWRDENFANPDTETYSALMPSLITLRDAGAMLIGISTVYRKTGLLYEKFAAHHGRDDPDALFVLAPSVSFNPLLGRGAEAAEIARQRLGDPERAAAEWDSEWRSDLSSFIDRRVIESLIDVGVRERAYVRGCHYTAFTDEAGGSGQDSSTLAIVHVEAEGMIVQDVARRWKPPFSPAAVIAEKAALLKSFRLTSVIGDRWGGGLPVEMYQQPHGIRFDQNAKVKSDIFVDFLHLANSGRVRILDEPVQAAELIGLERRTSWGGKEAISHSQNGHDDAANALCGACVLAASHKAPLSFPPGLADRLRAMPSVHGVQAGRYRIDPAAIDLEMLYRRRF